MISKFSCRCPYGGNQTETVTSLDNSQPNLKKARSDNDNNLITSSTSSNTAVLLPNTLPHHHEDEDEKCQWIGTIGELEMHLAVCNFTPINCAFASHGCTFKSTKRSMILHNTTDAHAHNLLLASKLDQLSRSLSDTEENLHAELRRERLLTDEKITKALQSYCRHSYPQTLKIKWRIPNVQECITRKRVVTSNIFRMSIPGVHTYSLVLSAQFGSALHPRETLRVNINCVPNEDQSRTVFPLSLENTSFNMFSEANNAEWVTVRDTPLITSHDDNYISVCTYKNLLTLGYVVNNCITIHVNVVINSQRDYLLIH